jgi:hypothetical protein
MSRANYWRDLQIVPKNALEQELLLCSSVHEAFSRLVPLEFDDENLIVAE